MKRSLPLFLCLLAFGLAAAQSGFRPGYVVTTTGDTLRGELDDNQKTAKLCRFRKDGLITEYHPDELTGYRFADDKYFASGVVDGAFVEVLVSGQLTLYRNGPTFLLRKDGGELYTLETGQVQTEVNGQKMTKQDTRWKGIISLLTFDCQALQNRLKNLHPNERNLTDIAVDYNKCQGTDYVAYKADIPWSKSEFGILAGVVNTTLSIKSTGGSPYLKDRYSSLDPSFGIWFNLLAPRLTKKIAFSAEINLTKASYSSYHESESTLLTQYDNIFINITTLSIPAGLVYTAVDRRYSLQFLAGVDYDNYVHSESSAKTEQVVSQSINTFSSTALQISRYQMGYWCGFSVLHTFGNIRSGLAFKFIETASASHIVHVPTSRLMTSLMFQIK